MTDLRAARNVNAWSRPARALLHATLQVALLCGCAPKVSMRVSQDALAELPLERRLTLLDAENDLLAAVDARDAQEEAVQRADAARKDAEQRKRDAEQNLSRARDAGEQATVAEAALRESQARIQLSEREVEVQRAELRVSEAALMMADARFELARATQVAAAALSHSRGVKPEKYQEQVDDLARVVAERSAQAKKERADADVAAANWQAARAELTRLTGGAQGSAWVQ